MAYRIQREKQMKTKNLINKILQTAMLLGATSALAAGELTASPGIDVTREGQEMVQAAADQAKATPQEIVSQKVNAIKWWVSKEGAAGPSEVTIQGNLEFAITHSNLLCTYAADVTKIAFRGGDGTLPRYIINNKLQSCK